MTQTIKQIPEHVELEKAREYYETKNKEIEVPRDPASCWKSYLLQSDEVRGLLAKIGVAASRFIPRGPPLHDCSLIIRAI